MGRSTKLTCFVPLNNVLTLSIVLLHKSKCARAYSFCAQAHLNVPKHNTTIDRDYIDIVIQQYVNRLVPSLLAIAVISRVRRRMKRRNS